MEPNVLAVFRLAFSVLPSSSLFISDSPFFLCSLGPFFFVRNSHLPKLKLLKNSNTRLREIRDMDLTVTDKVHPPHPLRPHPILSSCGVDFVQCIAFGF